MTGTYIATFANGVKKLYNVRRLTSISLHNNTITLYYGFSKVDGQTVFGSGSIEGIQAHETLTWSSEEKAIQEFQKLQTCMEELK